MSIWDNYERTIAVTQRAAKVVQEALMQRLGMPRPDETKRLLRRYRRMLAREGSGKGRRKARRVDVRREGERLIFRPKPFYVRTIQFSVGPGLVDEPKE